MKQGVGHNIQAIWENLPVPVHKSKCLDVGAFVCPLLVILSFGLLVILLYYMIVSDSCTSVHPCPPALLPCPPPQAFLWAAQGRILLLIVWRSIPPAFEIIPALSRSHLLIWPGVGSLKVYLVPNAIYELSLITAQQEQDICPREQFTD